MGAPTQRVNQAIVEALRRHQARPSVNASGTLELMIVQPLATNLPIGRRFMLRFGFIDSETLITGFPW